MTVYKARLGVANGAATWADQRYYENVDELRCDLLEAYLESAKNNKRGLTYRLAAVWARGLGRSPDSNRRYTKIISVERLSNDQWVPVSIDIIEPEVRIDGQ